MVDVSDVLWSECARYLNARNAHNLACTCRTSRFLLVDEGLWKHFTRELLSTRPRYIMMKEEEEKLETHPDFTSWYHYYVGLLENNKQPMLRREALLANRWFFNYTSTAGSCGKATVQEVMFREDGLLYFERGYPPMRWSMGGTESVYAPSIRQFANSLLSESQSLPQGYSLDDSLLQNNKQYIRIADFPVHDVEWNKDRWEWEIKNTNVVIWSVPDSKEAAEHCKYMPKECEPKIDV